MKYLVNRETKEHKIATPLAESIIKGYPDFKDDWQLVEANDEGWIGFKSTECPVPYGSKCDVILENGDVVCLTAPENFKWGGKEAIYDVCLYRPILSGTAEKEEHSEHFTTSGQWRPIPSDDDLPKRVTMYTGGGPSVFDRLRQATEAAESIPAILAEINALLPDGYCVTKREAVEQKQATIPGVGGVILTESAEDMTDWRNWKEGDFVTAIVDSPSGGYVAGRQYKITKMYDGVIDTAIDSRGQTDNGWAAYNFIFHSRPVKS